MYLEYFCITSRFREGKMAKVKSALEIALEKAGNIAALSKEEKERAQEEERLISVLREYYLGKFDSAGLWQRLKGSPRGILRKAQLNLINTFGIGISPDDMQTRKQAILAIETLKDPQNTAVIEADLLAVEALLREYQDMKDKAVEDLKRQLETQPRLRMRPVRSPDGKTVMQMMVSLDEAVKGRLSEFLSEHEEHFNEEFTELLSDLREHVT
jgi:predicted amidohydrolase YtcJ